MGILGRLKPPTSSLYRLFQPGFPCGFSDGDLVAKDHGAEPGSPGRRLTATLLAGCGRPWAP